MRQNKISQYILQLERTLCEPIIWWWYDNSIYYRGHHIIIKMLNNSNFSISIDGHCTDIKCTKDNRFNIQILALHISQICQKPVPFKEKPFLGPRKSK